VRTSSGFSGGGLSPATRIVHVNSAGTKSIGTSAGGGGGAAAAAPGVPSGALSLAVPVIALDGAPPHDAVNAAHKTVIRRVWHGAVMFRLPPRWHESTTESAAVDTI
jgi:hypothetical protein